MFKMGYEVYSHQLNVYKAQIKEHINQSSSRLHGLLCGPANDASVVLVKRANEMASIKLQEFHSLSELCNLDTSLSHAVLLYTAL